MRLVLATALFLASCAALPPQPDHVPSQVPPEIEAGLQQIGRVVDPPRTGELYAPLARKEPYAGVKTTRDVAYGPDARHRLDVFEPEAPTGSRPVLLFVHGGGFTAGNKRSGTSPFYDNIMLWAVANGMVGVNMTYRLAPQHPWPAAQEDIAAALRWVHGNVLRHHGDAARTFLMGHSAGAAHVAHYVAHPRFHVQPGGGIAGAILVSGLFAVPPGTVNAPINAYFGNDSSGHGAQSALPGLASTGVPLLFAFAELDPPEFPLQAKLLQDAMCAAHRCPRIHWLLGESHMSEVYSINTADQALTGLMLAFMRGHR
ncbi:carboxylesterase family protein [Ramlibacter alkalitolerans]|nr:alpha/beta hydrolase [Ramlibacter alkalitolerans]